MTHIITPCEEILRDEIRCPWPHDASKSVVRERDWIVRSSMESFVTFDCQEALLFLQALLLVHGSHVRTESCG